MLNGTNLSGSITIVCIMIGSLVRFLFTRLLPLVVFGVALFLGWLNRFPNPEGTLFTMFYPVLKGYLPPVISGGFSESPVPPLPAEDFSVEPYPGAKITLAGGDLAGGEDEAAGFEMPQQGIGMCCRYTAYDPESVRRTILWYLKQGGRHIDTADLYLNHEWIGEALQIAMRDYNIPREEIWVTTKLWPRSFGEDATKEAVDRMVLELKLDYVDLVLMHAPRKQIPFLGKKSECETKNLSHKDCRIETWKALSQVRATGKVRNVGVSNFSARQMKEIHELEDSVAPIANNQFQYNPWITANWQETFDYCQANNVAVTAYSSFSGTALQHMQALTAETLQRIASNHNTTVAQVLLKWAMQKGIIVIPGTGNPKHMKENLNSFELRLSPEEMTEIDALKDDEGAKKFFTAPPDDS